LQIVVIQITAYVQCAVHMLLCTSYCTILIVSNLKLMRITVYRPVEKTKLRWLLIVQVD